MQCARSIPCFFPNQHKQITTSQRRVVATVKTEERKRLKNKETNGKGQNIEAPGGFLECRVHASILLIYYM